MLILSAKVHNITLSYALKKAEDFLYGAKQRYIVTPNPEIVLHAEFDPCYRAIVNSASLSIPDGIGLVWASRLLYGRKRGLSGRIAGVDFIDMLLAHAHKSSLTKQVPLRFLLLGGKADVARNSARILKKKFPNFCFYSLQNIRNLHIHFLINEIIRPDCVLVALGAPAQEKWIRANLKRYPTIKLAMGVGGSFDFISGKILRAPKFMQKAGLEWFWRLIMQPWRVGRAYNAAVIFPIRVIRQKFKL